LASKAIKGLNMNIKNMSIGGSTNDITVLKHDINGASEVVPMKVTARILSALTSTECITIDSMEFWPEMNKVRVKFIMITDNSIVGSSLTLGCNGGFQWIGAPSNIASTLHQIFTHMSYKMATDLFFTAINESNVGASNVNPSSVVLLKVEETVVF
jgi:hypothetical protein